MAFLFLSLAITPFSLKAVGISPNLFAGLDAWRQISSVFGDNHQPITSSELLALNSFYSDESGIAVRDKGIDKIIIAQLQDEQSKAAMPAISDTSDTELRAEASSYHQKRCPKSAPRAKASELAAVISPEIEAREQMIEPPATPVAMVDPETIRRIERRFVQSRFEFNKAMKILPAKDFKIMVKLEGLNIALPVLAPKCDLRKARPAEPVRVREPRLRAIRLQIDDPSPSAPENCEL